MMAQYGDMTITLVLEFKWRNRTDRGHHCHIAIAFILTTIARNKGSIRMQSVPAVGTCQKILNWTAHNAPLSVLVCGSEDQRHYSANTGRERVVTLFMMQVAARQREPV